MRELLDRYGLPQWAVLGVLSVPLLATLLWIGGFIGGGGASGSQGPLVEPVSAGPDATPSVDPPSNSVVSGDQGAVTTTTISVPSSTPRPTTVTFETIDAAPGATAFTGLGATIVELGEPMPPELTAVDVATGPGGVVRLVSASGRAVDGGVWEHSGDGFRSSTLVVADAVEIVSVEISASGPWSVGFRTPSVSDPEG